MKKLLTIICFSLFLLGLSACNQEGKEENKTIKIIAPNGAPALSQVIIAHNALDKEYTIDSYQISFEVVNGPQAISSAITAKSHDIIIAPINIGAKLYKSNSTYKYAANISDGNIYLASTSPISLENLQDKNIVLFGEGTINALVTNYVFTENNIDSLNITYQADTNITQSLLTADENTNTIYLVAEPALSNARNKLKEQGKNVYTINIQEEFNKLTSLNFLQAGVFVKNDLDKKFVSSYLEVLEDSIISINENPETAVDYAKELNITSVLASAVPGSNLNFRLASDCKNSLNALVELDPSIFGGSISDDFYF